MKIVKKNFGKFLIFFGLMGFVAVGVLLFTNHPGFAIKITNYIYYTLFIGVVFELFDHAKK